MSREKRVTVRLSGPEIDRLDAIAGENGASRAGALRSLLRGAEISAAAAPTPAEAFALLAESARDGSVAARVALARLLAAPSSARTPVQRRRDELAARRLARGRG